MNRLKFDLHLHTDIIGCANNTMSLKNIIARCSELGCCKIAITDHLNSPDQLPAHREIRDNLLKIESSPIDIYFGVEVGDFSWSENSFYNAQMRDEYKFQFAIAGVHQPFAEKSESEELIKEYDLKKIIEVQHYHHLKVCENPLIDVMVHPYWFSRPQFKNLGFPVFDSMKDVPNSFARELGQKAIETNTAIEINTHSCLDPSYYSENFINEYIDYIAIIAATGAVFSIGSDAHDITHLDGITSAWSLIEKLNLPPEQIYKPKCQPLIAKNC